jgi:hypothetical protein
MGEYLPSETLHAADRLQAWPVSPSISDPAADHGIDETGAVLEPVRELSRNTRRPGAWGVESNPNIRNPNIRNQTSGVILRTSSAMSTNGQQTPTYIQPPSFE